MSKHIFKRPAILLSNVDNNVCCGYFNLVNSAGKEVA